MFEFIHSIYRILDPVFLTYFTIINTFYTFFLMIGAVGTYNRIKEVNAEDLTSILRSNSLPEITFIVPTYNDGERILACIENLTSLSYRYKRIIIVNDGSTDNTFDIMKKFLNLEQIPVFFKQILPSKPIRGIYKSTIYPAIIVIDKENGEKFDALNLALNACETTYFVVMDSDTFIEDSEFEAFIRPILSSPSVIAVGGGIKIKNGCKIKWNRIDASNFPNSYINAMQANEYLRSFLMRVGWDYIRGNYIISGAFGIFVTDIVIKSGGYGPTIANDMEIILRLDRIMRATSTPYDILYIPDPVAWTDVPQTWKELSSQRIRWHRGLLESLWFNKSVFLNPRYGLQGLFVHPFLLFFEAIEPLVEIAGYIYIIVGWALGIVDIVFAITFVLITVVFVFVQTLFTMMINEFSFSKYSSAKGMVKLCLYSLIEFLGYRQITLIWRAKGFWSFFKRYPEIKRDTKNLNSSIDRIIKKGRMR